jgi:hypothetical protein
MGFSGSRTGHRINDGGLRNVIIRVGCENGERVVDEWTWWTGHAQDIMQSSGSNQIVSIRERDTGKDRSLERTSIRWQNGIT